MDGPQVPRRRWLTVRTVSELTFVVSAVLTVALSHGSVPDLAFPAFMIACVAMFVFVSSVFNYRTMTLRARTQWLVGILAACGLMLVILLREMDSRDKAWLLCGVPAALVVLLFADAWCKQVGWTRESAYRYGLLLAPMWGITLLHWFGVTVPTRAERWPVVAWGFTVFFWPSRRLPPPPPRYGFRSSIVGTRREAAGHMGLMIDVPAPETWHLWMGDVILGTSTGTPWITPTIERTFAPDAEIRLYVVVACRSRVAQGTMAIADASGRIVHTTAIDIAMRTLDELPPPNDPLTGRPAPRPWRQAPATPPPLLWGGAIDIALPLSTLEPGPYAVGLTATDGTHTASHDVAIVVAPSPPSSQV